MAVCTGQASKAALRPVSFRYKRDLADTHLGFIAEDVPALVATTDRKSLSAMDIVAMLTRVVQRQQEELDSLRQSLRAK